MVSDKLMSITRYGSIVYYSIGVRDGPAGPAVAGPTFRQ